MRRCWITYSSPGKDNEVVRFFMRESVKEPLRACACACACARVLKPLVYFVFSWREHVWRERPPFLSLPHWQSFQSSRHSGIERTASPLTLRVERKGHVAPWWPDGHTNAIRATVHLHLPISLSYTLTHSQLSARGSLSRVSYLCGNSTPNSEAAAVHAWFKSPHGERQNPSNGGL